MGTQFWWFYDVLLVCVTGMLLYAAIAKGFNKIIFPFIGCIAAFGIAVAACLGDGLTNSMYRMLFQEKITVTVDAVLSEWSYADEISSQYQNMEKIADSDEAYPETLTAEDVTMLLSEMEQGKTAPVWFRTLMLNRAELLLEKRFSPHTETPLTEALEEDAALFQKFAVSLYQEDGGTAAAVLEQYWYCPGYRELVRIGLFLILEAAILIISWMIAAVAGSLEEQMHVRRFDRLLAVPVGLIEALILLVNFCIIVRFAILATDGQMLMFNQETIEKTQLFRYIYQFI